MSVCDPYREVELFCEQAQNEISQVFEPSTAECTSKPPTKNHVPEQQEQNENHHNSNAPVAEWEAGQVFSEIVADLNEMIKRYKLTRSFNDSYFVHKNRPDNYTSNNILQCTNTNLRNDKNISNGSLTNINESNGIYTPEDILIKELSASQSTLNSTDNIAAHENQTMHAGTQTTPSPAHSSTNLTWASDSCSSPYLTSPSDPDCLDDDSSSSVDGAHSSLIHGHTWCKKPELSAKSSSAPVLKKIPAKVNKQARSQSDRHLSEIEAAEACKWLRAAGFPQYAQMYEDMQFPVDITAAQLDHPHLEAAVLHSLYRRLQTLNNCARIHQQRVTHADDSEDEQCALSDNWTYQTDLGRWSRNCQNMQIPNIEETNSKEGWRGSLRRPKEVSDKLSESPKDKLRRAGSTKFRRRGVVLVEGGNDSGVLDILTKQLHDLNHSDPPASDSEITPKHTRRRKTKSLDKNDSCADNSSQTERVIWQPLPKEEDIAEETRINLEEGGRSISTLSSNQLQILRKLALLKLTAHMEKYCPSHRTGWNWDLPKFIRKMKTPLYKEKRIFGVPISITLQKTGLPMPKCVEEALEWLSQTACDQVGLFRKSGVRSRIQILRNLMESKGENLNFNEHQAYDVADMVKQFFRELPEALFTNKLSETFFLIFQHVPEVLHREAVLCALLLMPDEHCEVLQALLYFLSTIAEKSELNQMNENNLAVCFAPSLFHYSHISSNRQMLGTPQPRELAETKAAHDCLLYLLKNHNNLFNIPKELLNQCKSGEMKECSVGQLSELGTDNNGDWQTYLQDCQSALIKEAREKGRGWMPIHTYFQKVDVSYKKVIDGHPLRLWKCCAEIEAPPSEVLIRILRERHIWDEDLHSTRIVYQIDKHAEIFQYARRNIRPLPLEDYCIVRSWKTDLPKGSCLIVETSVEHPDAHNIPNSVRGIILASRYLIEPCGSGKSRLLHLSRVDTRGKMPEWYHKNYGHICALHVSNIQSSFKQNASGPESKV